jgi:hypothetical protein
MLVTPIVWIIWILDIRYCFGFRISCFGFRAFFVTQGIANENAPNQRAGVQYRVNETGIPVSKRN